jgi:hypothetical protein
MNDKFKKPDLQKLPSALGMKIFECDKCAAAHLVFYDRHDEPVIQARISIEHAVGLSRQLALFFMDQNGEEIKQ